MKKQVFLALMVMTIILPLSTAQGRERWENFREDAEVFLSANPQTTGSDMIHACVDKKSGILRIVDDSAKCQETERRLSWNAGGQQGPAAPTGGDSSIKVYDANGQFVGIYSGTVPVGGFLNNGIFVPDLNVFVCIDNSTSSGQNAGYPRYDSIFFTSEDKIMVYGKSRLFHACDGKYYIGTGYVMCEEIVAEHQNYNCQIFQFPQPQTKCLYEAQEFDISLLPFTLPVALPMRYE